MFHFGSASPKWTAGHWPLREWSEFSTCRTLHHSNARARGRVIGRAPKKQPARLLSAPRWRFGRRARPRGPHIVGCAAGQRRRRARPAERCPSREGADAGFMVGSLRDQRRRQIAEAQRRRCARRESYSDVRMLSKPRSQISPARISSTNATRKYTIIQALGSCYRKVRHRRI